MPERSTLARPALAIAVVTFVVHAALSGRYGFHRDEVYFIECGRHLAFGFADQPPITPLIAWLCTTLFGDHLVPLRIVAGLFHVGIIVMAALIARELGGRRGAQGRAAAAAAACPYFLGAGSLLATATIDVFAWALITLLVIKVIGHDDDRWWLWVGLAFGVSLQNKWMPMFLAIALLIGLATTIDGRRRLRSPLLWGGIGIAALIWAPNLVWQATHGWPSFEVMRNNSAAVQEDFGRARYWPEQVGLLLFLFPLAIVGLRWLWREERWRPLAVTAVAVALGQFVLGGKSYYTGGIFTLVLAAGAVAVSGVLHQAPARHVLAAGVTAVLALPFTAPVLPVPTMEALGVRDVNKELGEQIGWPELTDQVAEVYRSLPDDQRATARVITASYGEAGAIDLYGAARGIPRGTVLAGQNSYAEWWPDDAPTGVVISVRYPMSFIEQWFSGCEQVATVDNEHHVANNAYGSPIIVCQQARASIAELRRALRRLA
jgi:4-amino-4-deoxy-L-arabinose transferase-like glycosyltransferase